MMNNLSLSKRLLQYLSIILFSILILSCSERNEDKPVKAPINFQSGDECHLCGMLILKFSGPKAQAYRTHNSNVKKFCSTLDMFAWYLQPENKPNISEIYVHDMTQNDWDAPDDTRLIDARTAFFVIGSSKKGSMGNTLASFKREVDALDFANQWGGNVVSFEKISIEMTMM